MEPCHIFLGSYKRKYAYIWNPETANALLDLEANNFVLAGGGLGVDCIMFFVEALRLKI